MKNLEIYLNRVEKAYKKFREIVESARFISAQYEPKNNEELIHDKEIAAFYSTDQDAQDKEPGIQYWTYILESNNKSLDVGEIEIEESTKKSIYKFIDEHGEILSEKINARIDELHLPQEIANVAIGNFDMFLVETTFFDELSDFQKSLLDVYEKGGFPCGWRGEFPKGKMIIYSPIN